MIVKSAISGCSEEYNCSLSGGGLYDVRVHWLALWVIITKKKRVLWILWDCLGTDWPGQLYRTSMDSNNEESDAWSAWPRCWVFWRQWKWPAGEHRSRRGGRRSSWVIALICNEIMNMLFGQSTSKYEVPIFEIKQKCQINILSLFDNL